MKSVMAFTLLPLALTAPVARPGPEGAPANYPPYKSYGKYPKLPGKVQQDAESELEAVKELNAREAAPEPASAYGSYAPYAAYGKYPKVPSYPSYGKYTEDPAPEPVVVGDHIARDIAPEPDVPGAYGGYSPYSSYGQYPTDAARGAVDVGKPIARNAAPEPAPADGRSNSYSPYSLYGKYAIPPSNPSHDKDQHDAASRPAGEGVA